MKTSREHEVRSAMYLAAFSTMWSGCVGKLVIEAAVTDGALVLLGVGFVAAVDACIAVVLSWRSSARPSFIPALNKEAK